jgi:hypothetical protein
MRKEENWRPVKKTGRHRDHGKGNWPWLVDDDVCCISIETLPKKVQIDPSPMRKIQ